MAEALAVISLVSAAFSAVEQKKQSREQKKQNRISNKIAAISRRRGVKRQIAASRIQVAQQQATGFQLGVSGGTAVLGAEAGVRSDTASSIGASNLQAAGQGFIAESQNRVSTSQGNQAVFGAITSIAGGLATNPQAVAGLEDLFGIA